MEKNDVLTSYAGDMGKPEGVVFTFTNKDGKLKQEMKICYYAWNDKTGPSSGYGTTSLSIKAFFTLGGYCLELPFVSIEGSDNGVIKDEIGHQYNCGTLKNIEDGERKKGHMWYTLTIELNKMFLLLVENTACSLCYSASVNNTRTNDDDKKNISVILKELN